MAALSQELPFMSGPEEELLQLYKVSDGDVHNERANTKTMTTGETPTKMKL